MRLVGDVDNLRITESGRPSGTRADPTCRAARAAGLVRGDDVRVPLDLHGDHGLGCPLVRPEERADDPDLRIGTLQSLLQGRFECLGFFRAVLQYPDHHFMKLVRFVFQQPHDGGYGRGGVGAELTQRFSRLEPRKIILTGEEPDRTGHLGFQIRLA